MISFNVNNWRPLSSITRHPGKSPTLPSESVIGHPSSVVGVFKEQAQSFNSSSLPASISLRILLR